MKMLSRCYYHSCTSSVVTDRSLLDSNTVNDLLNLLPEESRHDLKYVTVCLEDGVAGEVDRDSLVSALEVFGQIRDTGVNPGDILRELKKKSGKVAPIVKATNVAGPAETPEGAGWRRKATKRGGRRAR